MTNTNNAEKTITLTYSEVVEKYGGKAHEPKSERLLISLTPSAKQALRDISYMTGESMNSIIGTAIDNYIKNGISK